MLRDIRKYLNASKQTYHSDKSSTLEFAKQTKLAGDVGKSKQLYKDIIKSDIKGRFKSILSSWFLMARSRLLHQAANHEGTDNQRQNNKKNEADEISSDGN